MYTMPQLVLFDITAAATINSQLIDAFSAVALRSRLVIWLTTCNLAEKVVPVA
jgi:hypothetical protein